MVTDFASLSRLDAEFDLLIANKLEWGMNRFETFKSRPRDTNLLFFNLRGEREYLVEDREQFVLYSGQTIFIPIGERYVSQARSEHSCGITVDFCLHIGDDPLFIGEPFRIFDDASLEGKITAVCESRDDRLRIRCGMYDILSRLSGSVRSERLSPEDRLVLDVITSLERHPETAPDIEALAQSCRMSLTGFRERFKRLCGGCTPIAYRNKIRCERARELLSSGSFTSSQIAELLGFWDSSHLYRTLHEFENVRN